MSPKTTEKPLTPAERMRLHRKRRRNGLRCMRILLHETEIDALIRKGFLPYLVERLRRGFRWWRSNRRSFVCSYSRSSARVAVSWLTCGEHSAVRLTPLVNAFIPIRLTSLVNAFIPMVGFHFLRPTRSLITD